MKSIELLALGLRLVGICAFILVLQSGLQSYYGFFAWREAEEGVLGLIFMNYMTLSVMAALCVLHGGHAGQGGNLVAAEDAGERPCHQGKH